jgi:hypothetical protein
MYSGILDATLITIVLLNVLIMTMRLVMTHFLSASHLTKYHGVVVDTHASNPRGLRFKSN